MIDFLPPELSLTVTLGLLVLSFVTSLITAAFGIGGGAIFLGASAVFLPAAAIIPVHGVVQLGSNGIRALMFARHILWTALPAFLVGSLIGVAVGGSIAVTLPPWLVQVAVGGFLFFVVLGRPPRWLSRWPIVTGAITSFLTMFFGATGPFVAGFVKSLDLNRHNHVATQAALMTIQHGLKVAMFGFLGFAYGPWTGFIVGLIGAGACGTYVGKHLLSQMSDHGFHRILNILLVLIAVRLIFGGVLAWLAA